MKYYFTTTWIESGDLYACRNDGIVFVFITGRCDCYRAGIVECDCADKRGWCAANESVQPPQLDTENFTYKYEDEP